MVRRAQRGLTLTELMVTVAIIAITAAVAFTSARTNASRSNRFFSQINSEMTRVRTQAIASGREYLVTFAPTVVTVAWQDAATGSGTFTTERTYNAPAGVEIYGVNDSETATPAVPNTFTNKSILFAPSGSVSDPATSGAMTGSTFFVYFACTTLIDGQPEGQYAFGITTLTGKTIGSRW